MYRPAPNPELKEQVAAIAAIYASLPSGAEADAQDREFVESHAGPHTATYGEITEAAGHRLLEWMRPGPEDCFVDVGSGVGALALQALVATRVGKVVGIELSPFRHQVAVKAAQALKLRQPSLTQRIDKDLDLRLGDFRNEFPDSASLIYAGSICFPDSLMGALARCILKSRDFRRLASLKDFPPSIASSFETLSVVDLNMSWADRVRATIYGPRRLQQSF